MVYRVHTRLAQQCLFKDNEIPQEIIKPDLQYIQELKIGITSKIIDDRMTVEDMKKCNTLFTKYKAISDVEVTFKDDTG